MKILQLNITEFGALKDKIIEPEGELNIIYGENESGKSTVLLFIKFMLYGLTRRSATNSERERSVSWSGHRAAGSMTLSHGGKNYRIERSFTDGTRSGSENLSILCLDDSSTVSTEKSPGEYFLGVPREAFEGSACIGQMRSADINGEKVAASIENMLSAADESVDTAKILKNLDSVRVGYRHKNKSGGSLFDDEQAINKLRIRIEKAKENSASLEEWERKLEQSRRDRLIVASEFEQKDTLLGELNKVMILKRFERLRAIGGELDQAKKELSECDSGLTVDGFMPDRAHTAELKLAARNFAEAQRLYDAQREQCESREITGFDESAASLGEQIEQNGGVAAILSEFNSARGSAKRQKTAIISSITLASVLALGGACAMLFVGALGAIGFVGLPIAAVVTLISAKKRAKAKKRIAQICESYSCQVNAIEARLDYCSAQLAVSRDVKLAKEKLEASLAQAQSNFEEKKNALGEIICRTQSDSQISIEAAKQEYVRLEALIAKREDLLRRIDALDTMLCSESDTLAHYSEEELKSEVSIDVDSVTPAAIAEAERVRKFLADKQRVLDTKITGLENTVMSLKMTAEDPMPLADELASLEEKYKRDSEFYDALTLAMDSIESAADAMRGSVTPIISRQASEILDKLSGGKYSVLRTTSTLGVSLDKDGYAIKSELLSSGTRDAAYISLRLALFMRIFEGELPPLILDESLAQLDDVRAQRMIALLGRLGGEGVQTLLFTSHSRESVIAERIGVSHSKIFL